MNKLSIKSVKVDGLYGMYNYMLPKSGEMHNAAILYGDNGSGKTSVLKLVFHLLSCANDKGHRKALLGSKFDKIEIVLHSGVSVTAKTIKTPTRCIHMEILQGKKLLAVWDYTGENSQTTTEQQSLFINEIYKSIHEIEKDLNIKSINRAKSELDINRILELAKARNEPKVPTGNKAFLSVLTEHAPCLFMLNAERRLMGDLVPDINEEVDLRKLRFEGVKSESDIITKSREITLNRSLTTTANWIRKRAVISANLGTTNVHSVYTSILSHLTSRLSSTTKAQEEDSNILDRLKSIEIRSANQAKYELNTALSVNDFRTAITSKSVSKRELATELLAPYIKSLERKLDAIDDVYNIVDKFINAANEFFTNKCIYFKLSQGFYIENSQKEKLSPSDLSSGEQQLLLLFCNILTASDKPTVFMIDEPEISLNIKWQRQLIKTLLLISENANVQFIFASHSMELLSQHSQRVIKMENLR